ncbi:hypothetical protein [Pseudomonas putida]|uniref:hypothetical protein n=1 Tax=Pseudomonas putida TaxID=303 RepID=UPI003D98BFEB
MLNTLGMHAFVLADLFAPFICARAYNAETANQSYNLLNLVPGSTGICTFDRKFDAHYIPLLCGTIVTFEK